MNLDYAYYLSRSGRYNSPQNSNDQLPIVYGDLTDGTSGIWKAPCIDTANDVYCFAGHETLSVANGNSVTVYENGVTANPANYTFSESNNYESEGTISTITFSVAPAENTVITVRGKGKPTATAGATLMENIMDIIYDFLVVETGALTSIGFDATFKARATSVFDAQSYKGAGVIIKDEVIWKTVTQMAASFLGTISVDGTNKLRVFLDNGIVPGDGSYDVIPSAEFDLVSAQVRRENIINRVPTSYAYDYANNGFLSHTDKAIYADTASIGIYGEKTPVNPYQFYWCRDITSVNIIQSILVDRHKAQDSLWEVTIKDYTLKRAYVDIGDFVVLTLREIYDSEGQKINEFFRVLDISQNHNNSTVSMRLLSTGSYKLGASAIYDGSYTYNADIYYGGGRDLTVY